MQDKRLLSASRNSQKNTVRQCLSDLFHCYQKTHLLGRVLLLQQISLITRNLGVIATVIAKNEEFVSKTQHSSYR